MLIIPENLTITPAETRREMKAVYGDVLTFDILLTDIPEGDDEYIAVLDYERVVFPVGREVCGIDSGYIYEESASDQISCYKVRFDLNLATARMQKWVSSLNRPSPICLQVIRLRDGAQTTLLLDDILCQPSVMDGNEVVQIGDPINALLDEKLDKPSNAGIEGEVISIDASGAIVWVDPASTGDAGRAVDLHNASPTAHADLFSGKVDYPSGGENGDALISTGEGVAWGRPWEEAENIITIPAATATKNLDDNCDYYHAPSTAPIYTLPAVTDETVAHEITIEVKFSAGALSVAFYDNAGTIVAPMRNPTISANSDIVFFIRWSIGKAKWCIMPVEMI